MQSDEKLSRGQKKKIRQQKQQEPLPPEVFEHHIRVPVPSGRDEDLESPCNSAHSDKSSNDIASASSSNISDDSESSSHDEVEDDDDTDLKQDSRAAPPSHVQGTRPLEGWPAPSGPKPPGWPPLGAELLSVHKGRSLPELRQRLLHLASLPCPQPNDPLQWRLFPLVRAALAMADEDLGSAELIRHVEGGLPASFLVGISSGRLRSLVSLVLAKNVRSGRLLQRGKRYALPPSEDATAVVPTLSCVNGRLEMLWVAWCVETKRPREVALRYSVAGPSASGAEIWLLARPSSGRGVVASNTSVRMRGSCSTKTIVKQASESHSRGPPGNLEPLPDGAEQIRVGTTDARYICATCKTGRSLRMDWWDASARTSWTLLVSSPLRSGQTQVSQEAIAEPLEHASPEVAVEVLRECLELSESCHS